MSKYRKRKLRKCKRLLNVHCHNSDFKLKKDYYIKDQYLIKDETVIGLVTSGVIEIAVEGFLHVEESEKYKA